MASDRHPDPQGSLFEETITRFWFLRQRTEVGTDGLTVRIAPFDWTTRHVPVEAIEGATVTTYSPSQYGGWHWGVRWSPGGNEVYRLRGRRGVELRLRDGTRLFVGSERPDSLRGAVERVVERQTS